MSDERVHAIGRDLFAAGLRPDDCSLAKLGQALQGRLIELSGKCPPPAASGKKPLRSDRDHLAPMAERPGQLHHYSRIASARGADIFLSDTEHEAIEKTS
jgi:hypothetical protein